MLKKDLKNNLSFVIMESIINYKDINPKKLSIEFKKNKFMVEYYDNKFNFNTPSLFLPHGINQNYKSHFIDVCINVDNNDTQLFRSKIIAIEKIIEEEYYLKKKIYSSKDYKRKFISNIKKNQEYLKLKIKQSDNKYLLDIYHDSNQKKINFNYKLLNQSFCSFLLSIGDIWEYENSWGYNLYINHIYIYIIKDLIEYSFISDDEDDNYSINSNDNYILNDENNIDEKQLFNEIIDNKNSLEICSDNLKQITINSEKKKSQKKI